MAAECPQFPPIAVSHFRGPLHTLQSTLSPNFPTGKAIHVNDICRMMKRRLKDIGLPLLYSPHSFRVTTITDLLTQGVVLEDVQRLAGHADPRTTRLYDRRDRKITRNIVERISV